MKNMTTIAILALGGLAVWQMSKAKPVGATPTGATKIVIAEEASIPLDAWQALTQEKLQGLPVTKQTGIIGAETYYKTSQPVAIGDTGFNIYGTTESGAVVIATRDPSTYEAWEWY